MKILFIIPNTSAYIHVFPQNIAYLVSVCRQAGHQVDIYNQDIHKWPDSHLTMVLDKKQFDVVGVGACGGYYQYKRIKEISKAVNASVNRKSFDYVVGGHLFAPDPMYFIKEFGIDHVFIGESDITFPKFLSGAIPGPVIEQEIVEDLDTIPWPAYDLFPMYYYRLVTANHKGNDDFVAYVLSARGCKFKCNFCYRMTPGYRTRKPFNVMQEIEFLQRKYRINYINFNEELLTGSEERIYEMCDAIEKSGLKFKWACDGRLNFITPKSLKRMKDCGCVFINFGIEAFDDTVLKNMNKALTTKIVTKGVEMTINAGITPGLNIIWGNIGDNLDTLDKGVKFITKYSDGTQMRTIRYVTGYPGTPMFEYAQKKGLVKDLADFYENKHKNSDLMSYNLMDISREEANKALCKANKILIDDYFSKQKNIYFKQTDDLYMNENVNFRGYRST